MARPASITQEQVNAIADTVRADGRKPNARLLLEIMKRELGVSPSMGTVLKLFQVWDANQVRAAESPIILPIGLQRSIVDFIGQEISSAKAELQEDLVTAQQANGDLILESERQVSTIELLEQTLADAQAEKAGLVGRLEQVEADLVKASEDAVLERQAAEHARTELAKAELRLEALPRIQEEADRLRTELDAERLLKVAAEQAAAVAEARFEGMQQRATKAETIVEKTETHVAQLAAELSDARGHAQAQQTALNAAIRECDELRRQENEARGAAKKSSEEAAELRGQLSAARTAQTAVKAKVPRKPV